MIRLEESAEVTGWGLPGVRLFSMGSENSERLRLINQEEERKAGSSESS